MQQGIGKEVHLYGNGFAVVSAAEDGAKGAAANDITELEAWEGDAGGRQGALAQCAAVALPAVHRWRAHPPRRDRLRLRHLALHRTVYQWLASLALLTSIH